MTSESAQPTNVVPLRHRRLLIGMAALVVAVVAFTMGRWWPASGPPEQAQPETEAAESAAPNVITLDEETREKIGLKVQAVEPQEAEPGQPPPRPVVDPDAPIISVVMERDLGSRRLNPALITIGSALLFTVFATMLHYRDKESMARRAALAGKK